MNLLSILLGACLASLVWALVMMRYIEHDMKDFPPYLDYPKPRKPQTNADRIRAMSDEELALFLSELANGDCPTIGDCPDGMQEKPVCTPSECWLSWLKATVEVDA